LEDIEPMGDDPREAKLLLEPSREVHSPVIVLRLDEAASDDSMILVDEHDWIDWRGAVPGPQANEQVRPVVPGQVDAFAESCKHAGPPWVSIGLLRSKSA